MAKRDNFSAQTKRLLAERAGFICSRCLIGTCGPHSTTEKSAKYGKASHITAAAPGGPRFDPDMTPEERSSYSNGIWLCLKCADMIDINAEGYSAELIRSWKTDHELRMKVITQKSIRIVPKIELSQLSDIANDAHLNVDEIQRIFGYKEIEIDANKLKNGGVNSRVIPRILMDLDKAKEFNNLRLIQYINSYIDGNLSAFPQSWRSLIAGFPVIGLDLQSPALSEIAALVRKHHPYMSGLSRKTYHQEVRKLLMGVLAELQAFYDDAATAGWFPLILSAYPSLKWWQDPFREYTKGISMKYDDALLAGNWSYMVPGPLGQHIHDVYKTWSGVLFDMISRLPDPDKQKGKLIPNFNLFDVLYSWCSVAPADFTPPLNTITRNTVSSSDKTFAGLYKSLRERIDL